MAITTEVRQVNTLEELAATVDAMWDKCGVWTGQNLSGQTLPQWPSSGIAFAGREVVAALLPPLIGQYTVTFRRSGTRGYVVIHPKDFMFRRGQADNDIRKYEQAVKEASEVMEQYRATKERNEALLTQLRAKREGATRGVDLWEVKATVEQWPEVIDFSYGPIVDPLTDQYLDHGSVVVTFLPTLYNGEPRGYGVDAWMPCTPIRVMITEGGSVQGLQAPDGHFQSIMPHLYLGDVCHGNLVQALKAPLQENNLIAAIDLIREWNIGATNHQLNRQWVQQSGEWWVWFLSRQEGYTRWLFDGKWDGRTVRAQVPSKGAAVAPIVSLTEFFGTDDALVFRHILPIDDPAGLEPAVWPTQAMTQKYIQFVNRDTTDDELTVCAWCHGKTEGGCPCHQARRVCTPCGARPDRCKCERYIDHPVVKGFRVNNNVRYGNIEYDASYRTERVDGRRCGVWPCQAVAVWRRHAMQGPYYLCQDHLNKGAVLAYEKALAEATTQFEQAQAKAQTKARTTARAVRED